MLYDELDPGQKSRVTRALSLYGDAKEEQDKADSLKARAKELAESVLAEVGEEKIDSDSGFIRINPAKRGPVNAKRLSEYAAVKWGVGAREFEAALEETCSRVGPSVLISIAKTEKILARNNG